MKKRNILLVTIGVMVVMSACKPEAPIKYAGTDGVYFNAAADSIVYSFARFPNKTADTIMVPVALVGNMKGHDRDINVGVNSGEGYNAVEGLHYRLLPPYTIPANSTHAMMPVEIRRTPDMDSLVISLALQLKENDQFSIGINEKSTVKLKIAFLQKPATWGDPTGLPWAGYSANFGTWTKTKYKLILDALYDPVSGTTITEFPIGSRFVGQYPAAYSQYLQIVRNYIRTHYPGNYSTPLGIGETLTDPDMPNNPVIQVGPANY